MIAAAMLVGPGEGHRYLDRTLRLAACWADVIVAYADAVDDDTIDALHHARARIARNGNGGPLFERDESLARNRLLAHCDRCLRDGTIVVVLDADEELVAPPGPRAALEQLAASPEDAWPITFEHLWDPAGQSIRVDGGWTPHHQLRAYRHVRGGRVPQKALASAATPHQDRVAADSPLVIRHWGYARPHDRHAKHDRYQRLDGGRYHSAAHLQSILDPDPEIRPCAS